MVFNTHTKLLTDAEPKLPLASDNGTGSENNPVSVCVARQQGRRVNKGKWM